MMMGHSFFSIVDLNYEGTWTPDKHVSNLFYLSSDSPGFNGIIDFNEIRWDREKDRLFFSMTKDTVPDELKYLFEDDETYRDVYSKTYRDRKKKYTEKKTKTMIRMTMTMMAIMDFRSNGIHDNRTCDILYN